MIVFERYRVSKTEDKFYFCFFVKYSYTYIYFYFRFKETGWEINHKISLQLEYTVIGKSNFTKLSLLEQLHRYIFFL